MPSLYQDADCHLCEAGITTKPMQKMVSVGVKTQLGWEPAYITKTLYDTIKSKLTEVSTEKGTH